MNVQELLKRLKNPGTLVSLASLIVLLLTTNGVSVDSERVMMTVKTLCSIGIIVGALNNTTTPGLDLPGLPAKEPETETETKQGAD